MRPLYLAGAVLEHEGHEEGIRQHRAEHGLNLPLLVEQLFANRIAAFFGMDVIVSALVLWVFVIAEGRRLGMRHLWVYFVCTLTVGVSLALPLFLYVRAGRLQQELV